MKNEQEESSSVAFSGRLPRSLVESHQCPTALSSWRDKAGKVKRRLFPCLCFCNLIAMDSKLIAMASNLKAMASNLIANYIRLLCVSFFLPYLPLLKAFLPCRLPDSHLTVVISAWQQSRVGCQEPLVASCS